MTLTVPRPTWNFRSVIVAFVALAVSLPMAWISLSKLVLYVASLVLIAAVAFNRTPAGSPRSPGFAWVILGSICLFALSLMWTTASMEYALQALVKHAKLVTILLIIYLLRSTADVDRALRFFVGGQAFVVVCSWMLAAGIGLPWVASSSVDNIVVKNVVFAQSYLDQSIMLACSAAVVWHLGRNYRIPQLFRLAFVATALASVIFLLPGRTGHLIVAALIALTLFWALPAQKRWWVTVMPIVLLGIAASFAPPATLEKFQTAINTGIGQRSSAVVQSSNDWRLNAWRLSLDATAESPLRGTGVGSWSPTVKKLQGADADQVFGPSEASNPHQEFLLWGVSLGLPGVALLIGIFALLVREASRFEPANRQATLSVLLAAFIACSLNSALFDDLIGDYLCVLVGLLIAHGRLHAQRLTSESMA